MERNISLNLLKVLACFAVIILHITGIIATKNNVYTISNSLYYIVGFAVPVFFIMKYAYILSRNIY